MTDEQTGELWRLVQEWMDSISYPPSQSKLAGKVGVSRSTMSDWKYKRGFPSPDHLRSLAYEIGVPYERVLDATLQDRGYRSPPRAIPKAGETA